MNILANAVGVPSIRPMSVPSLLPSPARHPGGRLVFAIPLITALISLALLFLAIVCGWFGEWTHTGSKFCEASRPGLIKQPVNTWSNLCFVIAGLYMGRLLWCGRYAANVNSLTRSTFYAAFFASLVVFVGPCSMAMHATETHLGGYLDLLSMHLVAAFITAFSMQRFFRLGVRTFAGLFLAVMVVCLYAQTLTMRVPVVGHPGSLAFALFILTGSIFEALNVFVRGLRHEKRYGFLSAGAIIAAFLVWNLSLTGCALCDPHSAIQGHGLWHVLCAVSLCFLFRYYVSEQPQA